MYIIYRRVLCPHVHRLHSSVASLHRGLRNPPPPSLLRRVYERRGIIRMAPSCVYPATPRINNGLEIASAVDRYCPSVPETTKTFSRDTSWLVREGGRRRRHSAQLVSYFRYQAGTDPCKDGRPSSGSSQIPCNGRMIERVIRFNDLRRPDLIFFLSFFSSLLFSRSMMKGRENFHLHSRSY